MKNILTIAGRQFRSYWNGPTAYIVLGLVLAALGWFFWGMFFLRGRASLREMFFWVGVLSCFAAPALSMGLLADEKRQGTIELLITLPVKDHEVVLGKFLGVYALYGVLALLTIPYPIAVAQFGQIDPGPVVTGYIGMLLQGGAMLAIGLMASSFTDNQVVAFFISLTIVNFLFWISWMMVQVSPGLAETIEWFSFGYHSAPMQRGVVDLRNVVYFLSLTALCLGFTYRSLERRRWS